ncbi:hypothetical protein [Chitiniphilus shinanonensis]|uniref:hypothetical protein n=1 Tax=Chitiniphilus shinanonensis TaxID=553088 RepID=UPI003065B258
MSAARPSKIVPRPGDMPPIAPRTGRPAKRDTTDHRNRVAALGCILCDLLGMPQTSKTDVHHIRHGQGAAQRASDYLTIPLCHDQCHQGPHGVHGDRSLLRLAKVEELDLLALTNQRLEQGV